MTNQLFPAVPGIEGVGIVKELGTDVTQVCLEDRVYIDAHRLADAGASAGTGMPCAHRWIGLGL